MYIAMNRFKISLGSEAAFEKVWHDRDSHLWDVPGFKNFHLIKGETFEDYTLYASHSTWESKESFNIWTKSEAFRQAHKGAGENRDMYLGHPVFEGFEVVL
ncbi:MAG: antibiotic biosynthesis monooxygenase [Paracoccaceae bacterium]|nr:antibiotic biosynthesis monooxygenase [Paracoccaceae bacterium]